MDKKLLTPGPLTTSMSTKKAMLHDWGSRDQKFIDLNQSIRDSLIKLIDGEGNYQCVPMQGSGTFAVESMISSLTPKDANILTIPDLRRRFKCEVGLSDHTLGVGVSVASVALGATVIEKHFTLNRDDGGVDSQFSMEPNEMKQLVTETEKARQALGRISYNLSSTEEKSIQYRRSLYAVKDIKAGDRCTPDNIKAIRPGLGLPTKHIEIIMTKKAKHDIKKGTPLKFEMLD